MRCANCLHAAADHSTGRCVHRNARLHAPTGVTVVEACRCKRYEDETAAPVQEAVAVLQPPEEPEAAPIMEDESEEEDETPSAFPRRGRISRTNQRADK